MPHRQESAGSWLLLGGLVLVVLLLLLVASLLAVLLLVLPVGLRGAVAVAGLGARVELVLLLLHIQQGSVTLGPVLAKGKDVQQYKNAFLYATFVKK